MEHPHTITIYNKIVIDREDKYYRTTLNNVLWYGSDTINISGKGITNSDDINIFIPVESLENYKKPNEYINLTDEERNDFFTLKKGDIVVKGESFDITSITDLKNYNDVITINKINDYLLGTNIDSILVSGK